MAEPSAPHDPARAAAVWRAALDRTLTMTTKSAYNRVAALLVHLRELYSAADDLDTFHRLLADVRTQHARRTSMLRRLDDAGL